MNANYVTMVKHDLDKLLATWFIILIKEATWFSLIVIMSKKKRKLKICVDFQKLNVITKKNQYPFLFTKEVLEMLASMKDIPFGLIFLLSPNHDSLRKQEQNNFHHRLGNFCLASHAIWLESLMFHLCTNE